MLSKKIILLGHFGVGKTSLIKRFIHQIFDEKYQTTIGVKVDKKVVDIHGVDLTMLIWDIAGEVKNERVHYSYMLGAHGILYVFDVTRPSTYENLTNEISQIRQTLPIAPIQVVGNKTDLLTENSLDSIKSHLSSSHIIYSSAKEGVSVENAFYDLGKAMLK
ncbi:GTP-binding protein [Fulvivirga sp. M361]|nr:GTP-binding protein [Fulvivirga sp. M361]